MMEPKETKNNLFLLTIVAIVAIVAIVIMIASTGSRTYTTEDYAGQAAKATASADFVTEGKPVTDAATVPTETELACTDTDGGKNYDVKGTVKSGSKKSTDYCRNYNSSTLVEYYCNRNKIASVDYVCPYGCEDGACKNYTEPYCGDGIIQPELGEQCDGSVPNGIDCTDFGYGGGTLSCDSNCRFDTTQCIQAPVCGDGVRNGLEQCDGYDLGGMQCTDIGSFQGGMLMCDSDCTFDISNCDAGYGYCGDNLINNFPNEQCDGTDWGQINSCTDLGFTGGLLSCNTPFEENRCNFDTSNCTGIGYGICGDGVINPGEQCEMGIPLTATCLDFGYYGGVLTCDYSTCMYDVSQCTMNATPYCGDGIIQPAFGEQCDPPGNTGLLCSELDPNIYTGGTVMCSSSCQYDLSGCIAGNVSNCGNGMIDPGEQCEIGQSTSCGLLFGNYTNGTITCNNDCTWNVNSCQYCTDTDGGSNYNVKGTASIYYGSGQLIDSQTDGCTNYPPGSRNPPTDWLLEKSCSNYYYGVYIFTYLFQHCDDGCANGRCLGVNESNNFTCYDSDPNNSPYILGTVSGTNGAGSYSLTDTCASSTHVYDYYCSNKVVKSAYIACPTTCSNGVCLQNQTQTGNLEVQTIPTGASIYVDNIYKGTTPRLVTNLTVGNHNIRLTRTGYYDYTTTKYIYAGQTTFLNVTLTANQTQTGNLYVQTIPTGASVYVDNIYRGVTPRTIINLTVGSHSVLLNKTGYYSYYTNSYVYAGQTTNLTVQLTANQTQTCSDTDGGINYYTIGTVIFTNGSYSYNYTDYCSGNTTLYERYCVGSTPSISVYTCPYACSGGRCINQTTSYDLYAQDILIQGAYGSNISINTNGTYNYVYGNSQVILKPQVTNTGSTAINAYNFFNRITFGSANSTNSTYTRCSSSNFWINPGITYTCNSDNVARTLLVGQPPYTISIGVDYYNNIAETNENNNARTEIIYVYSAKEDGR